MSCISESLQHPQTRFAAVRHWPTRSHEWDNVRGLTGSSPIVSCAKECLGASDLGIYEWDRVEIVCCQLQTPCFSENKNPKKLIQNTLKCCLRHATNVWFSCFFAPDAAFENRALRDFFTTPKECPIIPRFLPESLPPTSRCCRLVLWWWCCSIVRYQCWFLIYPTCTWFPTSIHSTTAMWLHACTFWPSRTAHDQTAHTLQMAHIWMVSWQDISIEWQPHTQGV